MPLKSIRKRFEFVTPIKRSCSEKSKKQHLFASTYFTRECERKVNELPLPEFSVQIKSAKFDEGGAMRL